MEENELSAMQGGTQRDCKAGIVRSSDVTSYLYILPFPKSVLPTSTILHSSPFPFLQLHLLSSQSQSVCPSVRFQNFSLSPPKSVLATSPPFLAEGLCSALPQLHWKFIYKTLSLLQTRCANRCNITNFDLTNCLWTLNLSPPVLQQSF